MLRGVNVWEGLCVIPTLPKLPVVERFCDDAMDATRGTDGEGPKNAIVDCTGGES